MTFLKTLFKKRQHQAGPLPPEIQFDTSSTHDDAEIAAILKRVLSSDATPGDLGRLKNVISELESGRSAPESSSNITPFTSTSGLSVATPSMTPVLTPSITPNLSPAVTPSTSPTASSRSSDPDFLTIRDPSDLQARFGTSTMPTPSAITPSMTPSRQPSAAATPRSPSTASDTSEPEIWEYKGNLLTRSALSLVMRQERLAMADSSGQYAGEVSWDDLRNAWIPKWAEKIKPEDLAEGELPSTNPADLVVKRKDAWGNAIGWREGRMFYQEEPKWEVPDD